MRSEHKDVDRTGLVDWESFIEENRNRIEREANSDAPDAWVFQRLLDYADGESS